MTDVATAPDQRSWRCTNCTRPLSDAQAVCVHCEPEFAETLRFRVRERLHLPPLHHCPACQEGFDLPAARLEPEAARWWRLQAWVWCCPKCRARLDWIPNQKMTRAICWTGVGALSWFGMATKDVWLNMQWHESDVIKAIWYVLVAMNFLALLWTMAFQTGLNPQPQPQMQSNYWPPVVLRRVIRFATGRFFLHTKKARVRTPWQIWAPVLVILGLYLGMDWWHKHGGFAVHANGLLIMLVLTTVVSYGGLFHAWRLRREARAEALQALNASPSSHAAQPPTEASPQ